MTAADFGAPLDAYRALQDGQVYHVQLLRSNDREHRWDVVFDGNVVVRVRPLSAFGNRPAGHVVISIESPEWADYTTHTDYDPATGVLLAEDYMMKLVVPSQQPVQQPDAPAAPEVRYAVEAEGWRYHIVKITRERVGSSADYDEAYEMVRNLQAHGDIARLAMPETTGEQ